MERKLKKPRLDSKVGRYYINRKKGMNQAQSAIAAGYADVSHTTQIERSKGFQALMYKDRLLEEITLKELAQEHVKNIRQDSDRGAKNTAIKMAYDKIEPQGEAGNVEERVIVVLK